MDIQVIASGSSGNAYRVSDGETVVLLDVGLPVKRIQEALHFQTSSLAGVLVSHEHGDHSKAVKDLAKMGIDIYAAQGTFDALGLSGHRYKAVKATQTFSIGTFKVLALDVKHDAAEPLAFVLYSTMTGEKLLYLTDSYYFKYKINGLTHIITECNYSDGIINRNAENGTISRYLRDRIYKSHMSLATVLEMLKSNDISKVQQIYLAHLSAANSDADLFQREVQKATGCEVIVCKPLQIVLSATESRLF